MWSINAYFDLQNKLQKKKNLHLDLESNSINHLLKLKFLHQRNLRLFFVLVII